MKDSNEENKENNINLDNDSINSEPEERQWRSDRHYKSNKKKIKTGAIAVGLTFLLALIAYTVILYGGKLIVDEEELILSSPTTIEAADGEVIWEIFDEYRLRIRLDDMPEDVKTSFVAIEDNRFYEHNSIEFMSNIHEVYNKC